MHVHAHVQMYMYCTMYMCVHVHVFVQKYIVHVHVHVYNVTQQTIVHVHVHVHCILNGAFKYIVNLLFRRICYQGYSRTFLVATSRVDIPNTDKTALIAPKLWYTVDYRATLAKVS